MEITSASNTKELSDSMEKTYEDGIRDGQFLSLQSQLKETKDEVHELTTDVNALKKAVWMLYGAITIIGFVIPLVWRWALGS
jgi:hypothetical protein